ncbi:MAG TPA: hypothetical protein VM784_09320 [Actinomycetota bacterium]|nr:hypothetical protein [Actinomycetota bacterium]HVM35531.1 hypothetical protein [Actinomycetota bacterium]
MQTILAGLVALRRSPFAFLPLTVEAAVAGVLVAVGAFPSGASSASAAGVFPLGTYFDLKQSLATGSGWAFVAAAMLLSVLVRSASLAATLWLADGARGPFAVSWLRTARVVAVAPLLLFPAAVLHFAGYALRYAPFVAMGAMAGVPAALVLVRRGIAVEAGRAIQRGKVPGVGSFLAYGYLVALSGAALAILGRAGTVGAGALVALMGPLHAIVLLGWRQQTRSEAEPGGAWVASATAVVCVVLVGMSLFDRTFGGARPAPDRRGRLMLLGGVDSTSSSGALIDLARGAFGFEPRRTILLSYRGREGPYEAADTRVDLLEVGRRVAVQIDGVRRPRFLLGHSQASLVLDRILVEGLPVPDVAVVLAGPPPFPPTLSVPPPGEEGPGKPAGDAARALSSLVEVAGLATFDIDAAASPTNLRPIVAPNSPIPRLSVWALLDSVWLEGDWRRPGEVNVVALTDHVGVTRDRYALGVADAFLRGKSVEGHELSWRGALVSTLRYAFEPWRPR